MAFALNNRTVGRYKHRRPLSLGLNVDKVVGIDCRADFLSCLRTESKCALVESYNDIRILSISVRAESGILRRLAAAAYSPGSGGIRQSSLPDGPLNSHRFFIKLISVTYFDCVSGGICICTAVITVLVVVFRRIIRVLFFGDRFRILKQRLIVDPS